MTVDHVRAWRIAFFLLLFWRRPHCRKLLPDRNN